MDEHGDQITGAVSGQAEDSPEQKEFITEPGSEAETPAERDARLEKLTEGQAIAASKRIIDRAKGALVLDDSSENLLRVDDQPTAFAMSQKDAQRLKSLEDGQSESSAPEIPMATGESGGFLGFLKGDRGGDVPDEGSQDEEVADIKRGIPTSDEYATEVAAGAMSAELNGGEAFGEDERFSDIPLGNSGRKVDGVVDRASEAAHKKMTKSLGDDEIDRIDGDY